MCILCCSDLIVSLLPRNEERGICSSSWKSAKHKNCVTHRHKQRQVYLAYTLTPSVHTATVLPASVQLAQGWTGLFQRFYPLLPLSYCWNIQDSWENWSNLKFSCLLLYFYYRLCCVIWFLSGGFLCSSSALLRCHPEHRGISPWLPAISEKLLLLFPAGAGGRKLTKTSFLFNCGG